MIAIIVVVTLFLFLVSPSIGVLLIPIVVLGLSFHYFGLIGVGVYFGVCLLFNMMLAAGK